MREPPLDVATESVLRAVRAEWHAGVDALEYLPVGFGAHHWRARQGDESRLFLSQAPTTSW